MKNHGRHGRHQHLGIDPRRNLQKDPDGQSEVEEQREKTVMGTGASEWSVVQILLGGKGRGRKYLRNLEMLSKNGLVGSQ